MAHFFLSSQARRVCVLWIVLLVVLSVPCGVSSERSPTFDDDRTVRTGAHEGVQAQVHTLHQRTFHARLGKHPVALVAFLSSECRHSSHFLGELEDASVAPALTDDSGRSPIYFATVDGPLNPRLLNTLDVEAFPVLLLFRFGEYIKEYKGDHDSLSVVRFALKHLQPPFPVFTSAEDVSIRLSKVFPDVAVVECGQDSSSSLLRPIAEEEVDEHDEHAFLFWEDRACARNVVVVSECESADRLRACFNLGKESAGGLPRRHSCCIAVTHAEGAESGQGADGVTSPVDGLGLSQWIVDRNIPRLGEIRGDNVRRYLAHNLPLAFLYLPLPSPPIPYCGSDIPSDEALECFRHRNVFVENEFHVVLSTLHSVSETLVQPEGSLPPPLFVWVRADEHPDGPQQVPVLEIAHFATGDRYVYSGSLQSTADVARWVADFSAGTLQPIPPPFRWHAGLFRIGFMTLAALLAAWRFNDIGLSGVGYPMGGALFFLAVQRLVVHVAWSGSYEYDAYGGVLYDAIVAASLCLWLTCSRRNGLWNIPGRVGGVVTAAPAVGVALQVVLGRHGAL